jgi:hypothetical protein|nr:MAG TPA: hypothetical protein [Caudoviricetes sp.]
MYATIQTTNQSAFKTVAGAIVDIKTIGKKLGIFVIFEITINCGLKDIDFDALRKMPDCLVKMDGQPYPDNWLTVDSAALKNNAPSGGVYVSSMGNIYPIIPFRRGDVDYYQYGDYEVMAQSYTQWALTETRNLLRQGMQKEAEKRFLSKYWTKVR